MITNWHVIRSGGSLTVRGKAADGSPMQLTRISRVERNDTGTGSTAVRKSSDGEDRFALA